MKRHRESRGSIEVVVSDGQIRIEERDRRGGIAQSIELKTADVAKVIRQLQDAVADQGPSPDAPSPSRSGVVEGGKR